MKSIFSSVSCVVHKYDNKKLFLVFLLGNFVIADDENLTKKMCATKFILVLIHCDCFRSILPVLIKMWAFWRLFEALELWEPFSGCFIVFKNSIFCIQSLLNPISIKVLQTTVTSFSKSHYSKNPFKKGEKTEILLSVFNL